MRTFLIFVAILAATRGEAGYSYAPPSNGVIGLPSISQFTTFSQVPAISSEISPIESYAQSYQPSGLNSFNQIPSSNTPFTSISSGPAQFELPRTYAPSFAPVAPIISKNLYFHLPPPDAEDEYIPNLPAPKINYNIIFVKTPEQKQPSLAAQILQQQSRNEEKTIVYVLAKKPSDLPIIPPKPPTKPEVYFIKYKTQNKNNVPDIGFGQNGGDLSIPDASFAKPSAVYGPPGYVN